MSNYTPATNFAPKDALASGNPAKIIKGTELSAEFNAIQTAIATKYDSSTTVPITSGGTGATSAAAARSNLGALGASDTAAKATNIVGGAGGSIPYQTAADTTALLANGTAGQYLKSNGGTSAPSWATVPTAQIQPISASVAGNALTISAGFLTLDFRSTTLGSGTVTTVSGTPSNLVISSGSTLGTVNGQQSRIVVLAINNAGTIELAAVNIAGGNQLDECNLISTTAEGGAGAADSANVIYSTTARSNVAYRVIGYVESTQATAGTWATAPSTVQGAGGNAMDAMQSLGYGQTWQAFTVTAQRNFGVTYYNTTGKPIEVTVTCNNSSQSNYTAVVNGQTMWISTHLASTAIQLAARCLVPPGQSYQITSSAGTPLSPVWTELR